MSRETYAVDVTIGATTPRPGLLTVEGLLGRHWHIETTMTAAELDTIGATAAPNMALPTLPVIAQTTHAVMTGHAEIHSYPPRPSSAVAEVRLLGAGPLAIVRHTPN